MVALPLLYPVVDDFRARLTARRVASIWPAISSSSTILRALTANGRLDGSRRRGFYAVSSRRNSNLIAPTHEIRRAALEHRSQVSQATSAWLLRARVMGASIKPAYGSHS